MKTLKTCLPKFLFCTFFLYIVFCSNAIAQSTSSIPDSLLNVDIDLRYIQSEKYAPLEVYMKAIGNKDLNYAWDFNNDGVIDHKGIWDVNIYYNPGEYTVRLLVSNGVDTVEIKKENLVKVEPSPATGPIHSSAHGGDWYDTATWIGGVVPNYYDSVYVNGPVTFDIYDWIFWFDVAFLQINRGASLKNNFAWSSFETHVYGDLVNYGTISQREGEIDWWELHVHKNLIDYGKIIKVQLWVTGEYLRPFQAFFSANTKEGRAPLDVEFTDKSVGEVKQWSWDFNNDGIIDSNEKSPKYIYDKPGIYSVQLNIKDSIHEDSLIKYDYIKVKPNPKHGPIYSTQDGGIWHDSSTWIGREIPSYYDSVIIDGPVTIDGPIKMHNGIFDGPTIELAYLQVNYIGSLQIDVLPNYGDSMVVYGDIVNYGIIYNERYDGPCIMTYNNLFNFGNITNLFVTVSGLGKNAIIGNGNFYWCTVSSHSSLDTMEIKGSPYFVSCEHNFYENVVILGQNDTMNLMCQKNPHFQIVYAQNRLWKGKVSGGGVINSYKDVRYSGITFSDITINGTISTRGSVVFGKDVILNDTILQRVIVYDANDPDYAKLFLTESFINNGVIMDDPENTFLDDDLQMQNTYLFIEASKNITNKGTWVNRKTFICGDSAQTITNNEGAVMKNLLLKANVDSATTFAWQKNGIDIPGADSAIYVIDSVAPYYSGTYVCITNKGNSRAIIINAGTYTPIQAGFSANTINGTAPLSVAFTDTSTGLINTWSWDFDNDGIEDSDMQSPNYVYSQPGLYSVLLAVGNQYESAYMLQEQLITVNEVIGVNQNQNSLKVYPTITSNFVYVEHSLPINIVEIYSETGIKILSTNVLGNSLQVDLADLESGIYLLKVQAENNQYYATKIIKN